MKTLLVGTGNRHKLEEISRVLAGRFRVLGADVLPPGPDVEETGGTFAENAAIKALAFAERAAQLPEAEQPDWVVADDSGLAVDALEGEPGLVLLAGYALTSSVLVSYAQARAELVVPGFRVGLLERAERYATTICLTPGNRSGELPLTPETLACLEEFEGAPLGLWLDTCRLPGEFLRVPRIADTAGQASGLELFDKVEGASVSDEAPGGTLCNPGEGAVPWDLITSSLRSLPLWCVNALAGDGLAEGLRFLGGLDGEREAPGELLGG